MMGDPPWLLASGEALVAGRTVHLADGEARHLGGPLRRRAGDEVVLVDGAGTLATGRVARLGRGRAAVEVVRVEHRPRPTGLELTVGLVTLHGEAMNWAVVKAVEVGVARFVPLVGERGQVGFRTAAVRLDRWRRAAAQALKQCRRPWAMEVAEPSGIGGFVRSAGNGILADRRGLAPSAVRRQQALALLVGPEGGLTPAELALLAEAGWQRMRLGRHVMRAETAAVVGAALLLADQAE